MALTTIGGKPDVYYAALSTDISAGKIDGISVPGAVLYLIDTGEKKIVNQDFTLSNYDESGYDYVTQIALGNKTGRDYVHKFGLAPDFDLGDGAVTVWDGANDGTLDQMQYVYSTTAAIDTISSSDDTDTQSLEIQGLDENYALVVQTKALTGQTKATLDTPLIRVFRVKNMGTTDLSGTAYVYEDSSIVTGVPSDSTKVRAVVGIGRNQTLMAVYTIPAGTTGLLWNFYFETAGASKDTTYIYELRARDVGGVFQTKHVGSISDVGSSNGSHVYKVPQAFDEKTDIELRVQATSTAVGAAVSAGFELELVDN